MTVWRHRFWRYSQAPPRTSLLVRRTEIHHPRFPEPKDTLSPSSPEYHSFRAIFFPEVTTPICRLPLTTLFHNYRLHTLGTCCGFWYGHDTGYSQPSTLNLQRSIKRPGMHSQGFTWTMVINPKWPTKSLWTIPLQWLQLFLLAVCSV